MNVVEERRQGSLMNECFARRVSGFLDMVNWAKEHELFPCLEAVEGVIGPHTSYRGRDLLMFASNDYLGLAHDPRVVERAAEAMRKFGTGRGGAPLVCGHTELHKELERELAHFLGGEACVLFPSGYQANVGCVSALTRKADCVIADEICHASIHDGLLVSHASVRLFPHNNLEMLRDCLVASKSAHKVIVVDGVYSMHGNLAPLPDLLLLAREHDAFLIIDDAHGIGTVGPNGRGTAEHFGCEDEIDLISGTMSKSLASAGGFAVGDAGVIDYIRHQARAVVFSASPPPANVGAALAALEILRSEPQRRERTQAMADRMRGALREMGLNTLGDGTPIVPIMIGNRLRTGLGYRRLFEAGLISIPVISPGVPAGQELLRMHVTAAHTDRDIDRAIDIFEQCLDVFGASEAALAETIPTDSRSSAFHAD